MSNRNDLPEIKGSLVYIDVINPKFGGFSPETDAGQELLAVIGAMEEDINGTA